MTSLLRAHGVGIDGQLSAIDLSVEAGQMVAVIGPNGGGKTSLLRALARTEDSRGCTSIDGREVDSTSELERRRLLAFLPASRESIWPISVTDYLSFGLVGDDPARLDELIEQLELAPFAKRTIDRLSTGERARVMIGRAIAGRPRLLLLDEPLSNLDPYWALRIIEVVRTQITSDRSSAIVSVHELDLACRFDRLILVSGGQLVADGTAAELVESPAFHDAFRIVRAERGWAISSTADPRSSQ